ncbi:mandelate racemase/muconate lactonizing enzyme family protein [Vitiosangium sp. GDMCC 1.1324]|uniref:mandelate racemase/muconate lactonizing enzyme family protein n=1 Tax=Vitiosangium sp. (strain GDMCC 1.1324) TaxID=2138576 RepID=UPI000D35C25E|nr:enolase C-terminal domain-like protein [Vitiosangium sp. GDMCC 1.1324]PTL80777.1 o-succinylbenzoate synthase [Vitiosangium sp. GDMCC 1.1324]
MRITEVGLHPLRLEMVNPLKTARGTYAAREGFVVRLRDEEGRVGQGEAMPLREFGTEAPSDCEQALKSVLTRLRGPLEPLPLGEGWDEELGLSTRTPAARHAVEQALLDLLAQREGVPLCRLLSAESREVVQVNALLGSSSAEALAEEARRAVAEGYETLKIKVAGRPLEEDSARLQAVRRVVGPAVRLRVDANGGWTEPDAEQALAELGRYQLELCEQPVAAEDHEALSRLSERAPCPLAADESLALPEVRRSILDRPRTVSVLVLKPMVLGGLLPTLSLAREAAKRGMDAYVTSSLDGVSARAGAAHVAAALPSGKYASGLGVGHLFKDEPGSHPFRPVRGRIELPRTPGQGVH